MRELLSRMGIDKEGFYLALESDLSDLWGVPAGGYEASALAGGASIRGYARLRLEGGEAPETVVLMILSDPDPAKGVEEVMAQGLIRELPFINVHRHLEACGVPVPEIFHYDREAGLIYIEDCGQVHLRAMAEGDDREERQRWFERSILELCRIHVDATRRESEDFLGFKVRFDRKLLRWELDHFTRYAITERFPGRLKGDDLSRIDSVFEGMVDELLAGPYSLQHRDYMLDNLMIKDGSIKVLDFQDALMGPLNYDLACLLFDRDTSFFLGPELIEHLAGFYREAYCDRSGEKMDRSLLARNFELCVMHRLLKVVGRFHFIDQVKKRPEFLRFIPFMLPPLAEYLGRGERESRLLEILEGLLPEFSELARS